MKLLHDYDNLKVPLKGVIHFEHINSGDYTE